MTREEAHMFKYFLWSAFKSVTRGAKNGEKGIITPKSAKTLDLIVRILYNNRTVLGGEPAVPCTYNPLQ